MFKKFGINWLIPRNTLTVQSKLVLAHANTLYGVFAMTWEQGGPVERPEYPYWCSIQQDRLVLHQDSICTKMEEGRQFSRHGDGEGRVVQAQEGLNRGGLCPAEEERTEDLTYPNPLPGPVNPTWGYLGLPHGGGG